MFLLSQRVPDPIRPVGAGGAGGAVVPLLSCCGEARLMHTPLWGPMLIGSESTPFCRVLSSQPHSTHASGTRRATYKADVDLSARHVHADSGLEFMAPFSGGEFCAWEAEMGTCQLELLFHSRKAFHPPTADRTHSTNNNAITWPAFVRCCSCLRRRSHLFMHQKTVHTNNTKKNILSDLTSDTPENQQHPAPPPSLWVRDPEAAMPVGKEIHGRIGKTL
jgi:hypothetical protein